MDSEIELSVHVVTVPRVFNPGTNNYGTVGKNIPVYMKNKLYLKFASNALIFDTDQNCQRGCKTGRQIANDGKRHTPPGQPFYRAKLQ
jgi:hypothetical protein